MRVYPDRNTKAKIALPILRLLLHCSFKLAMAKTDKFVILAKKADLLEYFVPNRIYKYQGFLCFYHAISIPSAEYSSLPRTILILWLYQRHALNV
jgi:hypothetical protein